LALQGAFAEHIAILKRLGIDAVEVRRAEQVDDLAGLIIPGGESTTMLKLADYYRLNEAIKIAAGGGLPIWGTCAGAILLAMEVNNTGLTAFVSLGLMNIAVRRNAFGRQVESFEVKLPVTGLGDEPFPAVFIRAPIIESALPPAEVLARLGNGTIVAVRQDHMLATSFHPELSLDDRFHRYFVKMVGDFQASRRF
jgi:5'-phosphate synthase pdxT subunit